MSLETLTLKQHHSQKKTKTQKTKKKFGFVSI